MSSGHNIGHKVIIAGNWKMHKTRAEARALAEALKEALAGEKELPEVILIPPFTALDVVGQVIHGTGLQLGAQNMDYRDQGAFTGEVSPLMLKDLGVKYVLIGHSERRQLFGETNATTNLRVKAAIQHGLFPILCVGETLDERESELTDSVISRQVAAGLQDVDVSHLDKLIIAYEPVWAIGTGKTCEAEEANRVAKLIRNTLHSLYTKGNQERSLADSVPVLYGGSMNPSNVDKQLGHTDIDLIDGGLVGGASLKAHDFVQLIHAGKRRVSLMLSTAAKKGT